MKVTDKSWFLTIWILVSFKNVSCIDLTLHVIKASIIAIGYDSLTLCLKLRKLLTTFEPKMLYHL